MKKFIALLLTLGLTSVFAADAVKADKKMEVKTEKKVTHTKAKAKKATHKKAKKAHKKVKAEKKVTAKKMETKKATK